MLSGVRVLSFTHFLQGPSASQLLGDLGAEVIKIEPLGGAFERSWSGPDAYLDGESVFFLLGNRNVKSLAIDLKAVQARGVLEDLVTSADVLIESYRPGAMDRLGLGYDAMRMINPRLVYCSLSGYGSEGPYRDRPGQDILLQALSGLASMTGRSSDPPTPTGASLIDQHGAVLGALGVLAALHGRERTGRGCRVESNLLNAALDLQIEPLGYFLNGFTADRSPAGVASRYYKAPYGVFETSDGHICLSINSLSAVASAIDDPWLAQVDERDAFAQRDEINQHIQTHIRTHDTATWERIFSHHKIWFSPVHEYQDVVTDPQVNYNDSFVNFTHPRAGTVTVLGHPVQYDGVRPGVRTAPPALGADTREILRSLNYDNEAIQDMFEAGVLR